MTRTTMKFRHLLATIGIGALTLGLAVPVAASADDGADEEALEAVDAVAPDVLADAADILSATSAAIEYAAGGTVVEVPLSPDVASTMSLDGIEVAVSLPFGDVAQDGELVDDGVVVVDNGNSSATVPVARQDGGLQILTVIEGPEAPTRYDYRLTLEGGGSAAMREDGAIFLADGEGAFAGVIAPAWAKDANGVVVRTWYEIEGTIITQVVEHDASTAYPVVADPWMGIQLFSGSRQGRWRGAPTYNASVTVAGLLVLSGGGAGIGNYLIGQQIFRTNGFDEWASRWSDMRVYGTLRSQFDCHVAAGAIGVRWTGEYNLERATPNRYPWPAGVLQHHCNW